MYLDFLASTSLYSRYSADMSLTAKDQVSLVGSISDLVLVDLPTAYDLEFVSSLTTCDSSLTADTETDACSTSLNRFIINAYRAVVDNSTAT
jgi:hypothetical protein